LTLVTQFGFVVFRAEATNNVYIADFIIFRQAWKSIREIIFLDNNLFLRMGNVSAKLVSESAIEKLQRHERSDVDGLSMESPPDSPGHPVKNIVIVNGLGKHIPDSPSLTETLPTTENDSLISGLSDERTRVTSIVVKQWDGIKHYSDFILDGLRFRKEDASNVVMLFESPSSSDRATSFFNGQVYKFHDFPPEPTIYKSVLAPCRYSVVNGNTFPSYLRDPAPEGLMEHWRKFVPGFVEPTFVREINFGVKFLQQVDAENNLMI